MYEVLLSATFVRRFRDLPETTQRRIRDALEALGVDPRTPRPGADIKPLRATDPPKHRLRVGTYRVVYTIEGRRVKVLDLFARERGYSQ